MYTIKLASEIVIGLNIAYEKNLPLAAVETVKLIIDEHNAAQHSVQSDGAKVRTCGCKDGASGIHANFCLFYEPPHR